MSLSFFLVSSTWAQAKREAPEAAFGFFEKAKEAYYLGNYKEAAKFLESALLLDPGAPTLLQNLGRVYELLGELEKAIEAYSRLREVLLQQSMHEEAKNIERAIERVRGARMLQAPSKPSAPMASPPSQETSKPPFEEGPTYVKQRGIIDEWFWGGMGMSGFLLIGGSIAGAHALSLHNGLKGRRLGENFGWSEYLSQWNEAKGFALAADLLFVASGLAFVASWLLFAMREKVYEEWKNNLRSHIDVIQGMGDGFTLRF
ncbi:MAG: tetratricopeptide repeat protein [Deltaproteobacteria bacterium]|nr:tetratricopeptide repeat protein [Deltaproteobacteria bacterium]